jgi:PhzF family phenazine biosynthesis protein
MQHPLWTIDAFTDRAFHGNPAAVCLLDEARPDQWMQQVAAELALSETAFLLRDNGGFSLRWFTPTTEVDLCGHATIASAHFLWEGGHLKPRAEARFQTRSGLLTARERERWITLDFPSTPAAPAYPPHGLEEALGAAVVRVGRSVYDLLVELESEAVVRRVRPDLEAIREMPARGVIITARSETTGYDFVSRVFAPASGVPEDPATGSAHCALGPWWAEVLGKDDLIGFQASARGGVVRVEVRGDRVRLAGQAVTVCRGTLEAN